MATRAPEGGARRRAQGERAQGLQGPSAGARSRLLWEVERWRARPAPAVVWGVGKGWSEGSFNIKINGQLEQVPVARVQRRALVRRLRVGIVLELRSRQQPLSRPATRAMVHPDEAPPPVVISGRQRFARDLVWAGAAPLSRRRPPTRAAPAGEPKAAAEVHRRAEGGAPNSAGQQSAPHRGRRARWLATGEPRRWTCSRCATSRASAAPGRPKGRTRAAWSAPSTSRRRCSPSWTTTSRAISIRRLYLANIRLRGGIINSERRPHRAPVVLRPAGGKPSYITIRGAPAYRAILAAARLR